MLKSYFLFFLFFGLIYISCKKEPVINSTPATVQPPLPPAPPPPNPERTAPKTWAGLDYAVPLPANSCVLYGFAEDAESYAWRKISGPVSFNMDNPQSKTINITNLEKGIYEFELTVSAGGLTGKDTISVEVYDPRIAGVNEYVFKNLRWTCPMGCSLNIENFNLYVTPGTPIKVYIKFGNANAWVLVPDQSLWTDSTKYVYGRSDTHFMVYTDDQEGLMDVKITF